MQIMIIPSVKSRLSYPSSLALNTKRVTEKRRVPILQCTMHNRSKWNPCTTHLWSVLLTILAVVLVQGRSSQASHRPLHSSPNGSYTSDRYRYPTNMGSHTHRSEEYRPSSSPSVSLWNPRGGGNETQRKRRRSPQKFQRERQYQGRMARDGATRVYHEQTKPRSSVPKSNGRYKRKQPNEWIGVPPVRIGGMALNPAQDERLSQDLHDSHDSRNSQDSQDPIHTAPHPTITLTHTTSSHTSLLQVPCSLLLQHTSHPNPSTSAPIPVSTYLDTGAQGTIMTLRAVKRAGLSHLIDTRYAGRAVGVAGVSCRVIGRIPARTVGFVFRTGSTEDTFGGNEVVVDRSPSICVLEEGIGDCAPSQADGHTSEGNSIELLLGLDALEEWNAAICLRDRTLTIRSPDKTNDQDLVISFLEKNDTTRTRTSPPDEEDSQPPSSSSSARVSTATPSSSHNNRRYRRATLKSTAAINARKPQPPPDANKRLTNYPSSSIPWVISSRRMPTTDLESDLDLLDSTNTGKKPPSRNLSSVHDTADGIKTTFDHEYRDDHDEDEDDEDYFESDNEYDGCNLSGI